MTPLAVSLSNPEKKISSHDESRVAFARSSFFHSSWAPLFHSVVFAFPHIRLDQSRLGPVRNSGGVSVTSSARPSTQALALRLPGGGRRRLTSATRFRRYVAVPFLCVAESAFEAGTEAREIPDKVLRLARHVIGFPRNSSAPSLAGPPPLPRSLRSRPLI
ncbi:hypothetical protein H6P81_018765 [Aristolochia fimbriata]|uniref:Uncharacterized protein n=1 Tax=Aristolochia fimbriata TaxID=158543 RepID=A0AAV7E3H0_ARIFI|nr:hypothetical protein H6P81_018765 [Aristolochia fimbriata]